jgi:hypothetical protein
MKLLNSIVAVLLCPLMIATTGCSVSQAKINTVVQDIANWTPTIAGDATLLLTEIASFEPADAATISGAVSVINADSQELATLCKQYLASPSPTVLGQIAALVGSMATANSGALISALQIKNAQSQNLAHGILALIATAVTILSALLQSVNVQPTSTVASTLEQLKPHVDRVALNTALDAAKNQGLAPQNTTIEALGF